MYLVWFPDNMGNNYIEKIETVSYQTGGDTTYARCYILRPVKDGVVDKTDIGIGFFNLYGLYDIDNAVQKDWDASIPTFVQIYYLLSSKEVHELLAAYGVIYTDALEWFDFDEEKTMIAQDAISKINKYYHIREEARKAFDSTNRLENYDF